MPVSGCGEVSFIAGECNGTLRELSMKRFIILGMIWPVPPAIESKAMDRRTAECEATIAAVAQTGRRRATPCGDGEVVWHLFGEGRPVVFLHGGMGSWAHFIRNIPALSRAMTMLVPDIPGHMRSAMPPEPYTPESIAQILVDGVHEILGPSPRWSVVGFSFGSAIAGHVARLGGNRVETFVMTSPGGLGLPRGRIDGIQRGRGLPDDAARFAIHRRNLEVSMFADPAHVDDLAVYVHMQAAECAKLHSAPISFSDTMQACLPQVSATLAAIWGAQDPASSPYMDVRRAFIRGVQPAARLVEIDNASHWVPYEQSDAYNAVLLDLLDFHWRPR
jgi:pimeloyl-ACP methyl ester carboxylesterase